MNKFVLITLLCASATMASGAYASESKLTYFVECERLLKGPVAEEGEAYIRRGLEQIGKAKVYFISPGLREKGAALVGLRTDDSTHVVGGTQASPIRFEVDGKELAIYRNQESIAWFPYDLDEAKLNFWRRITLDEDTFSNWQARKRDRKPSLKVDLKDYEFEPTPQVGLILKEDKDTRVVLKVTRPRAIGGVESSIYNFELAIDVPCDKADEYVLDYRHARNRAQYALSGSRDLRCRFDVMQAILHDFPKP